jgi:hypothetical protein
MVDIKNTLFVYINLDDRIEKRDYMENLLSSMNLNYVRYSAIKPTEKSLIEGEYKSFYDRSVFWMKKYLEDEDDTDKQKLAIGTYGCYLSHYFALKQYSSKHSSIVILEDDVMFNIQNLKKFFRLTSKFNLNDLVLCRPLSGKSKEALNSVGSSSFSFNSVHRSSKYVGDTIPHQNFRATHFVYYHNINKVLDYLDDENVFNIDSIYCSNYINSFLIAVNIWQNRKVFPSDIGSFSSVNKVDKT